MTKRFTPIGMQWLGTRRVVRDEAVWWSSSCDGKTFCVEASRARRRAHAGSSNFCPCRTLRNSYTQGIPAL